MAAKQYGQLGLLETLAMAFALRQQCGLNFRGPSQGETSGGQYTVSMAINFRRSAPETNWICAGDENYSGETNLLESSP
jgi:hypothetical protein